MHFLSTVEGNVDRNSSDITWKKLDARLFVAWPIKYNPGNFYINQLCSFFGHFNDFALCTAIEETAFCNCCLTLIQHSRTNLDFVNISGTAHHLQTGPDQFFSDSRSNADRGSGHQSHSAAPSVHLGQKNRKLTSKCKTYTLPHISQFAELAPYFRSRDYCCHSSSADPDCKL